MHTSVLVADEGDIYDLLDRFSQYDHEEEKPEGRWDYFGVGGLYAGALRLKARRKVRRWFGLFPRWVTDVSVAKKRDIDEEAFLKEPPTALFFRNELHECPLFAEGQELEDWQTQFRKLFAEIPDDATLQIVDAHS